jgi:Fur family transcriptional regulator, ferric uptake regulator
MSREERSILEAHLKAKGLKMTAPREAVLQAFLQREGHMTAEDLLKAVRRLKPGIGQATVFRTIKLFAEAGLARNACKDDGARQFEHAFRHSHHDHLVCVECGAVVEFVDKAIERAQEAIYKAHGYDSSGHRLELLGRCPACAARRQDRTSPGTRANGKARQA